MIRLLPLLLLLVATLPTNALADRVYTIGVSCPFGDQCKAPELENTLAEVYSRTGKKTRFVYAPRLRELQDANSGKVDATAVCSVAALQTLPNLALLPTPLIQIDVRAFSLDPNIVIAAPEDLASLVVGAIRGQFLSVTLAKKETASLHEVNDIENLISMLQLGRLDAILLNRTTGNMLLKKMGITEYTESASLHHEFLYHAVNKNSYTQEETAELDAVLRAMLHDGTVQRLFGRFHGMTPTLPIPKDALAPQTQEGAPAKNEAP